MTEFVYASTLYTQAAVSMSKVRGAAYIQVNLLTVTDVSTICAKKEHQKGKL